MTPLQGWYLLNVDGPVPSDEKAREGISDAFLAAKQRIAELDPAEVIDRAIDLIQSTVEMMWEYAEETGIDLAIENPEFADQVQSSQRTVLAILTVGDIMDQIEEVVEELE